VASRLVTGTRRWRDYITSVMRQLYWLRVRQRIEFKVAVPVYKSLHDLIAPYLSTTASLWRKRDACTSGHRTSTLVHGAVPRAQTRLGDKSFTVAGPRLWNCLPVELWQRHVYQAGFRRLLKTFLFRWE